MDVSIIDARQDHPSDLVAGLVWSTDPELMVYLFGTPERWRRVFADDWTDAAGALSYPVSRLAVRGEDVLGLLVSAPAEEFEARWERTSGRQAPGEDPAFRRRLARRLERIGWLFPAPLPGSYYIFELAVAPAARGLGLGRRLLEAARGMARAAGCTRICLDVAAENAAVGFYQRLGMSVAAETRVPELAERHGLGTHYHMMLEV